MTSTASPSCCWHEEGHHSVDLAGGSDAYNIGQIQDLSQAFGVIVELPRGHRQASLLLQEPLGPQNQRTVMS